eukprot:TRINITY_DN3487_c0_g1_i1.p1 TRINITY_DN3487_c0_g1~~TRINITY_DN3487_c0_g1_i1.p1  ORF type:complete len:329 (+),score=57.61 TRINITY_DN3487_c0_g1_i1:433-1419(+)
MTSDSHRAVESALYKYQWVGKNPRGGDYLCTATVSREGRSLFYLRTSLGNVGIQELTSNKLQEIVTVVDDTASEGAMNGPPLLVDPALAFSKLPTGFRTAEQEYAPGISFKQPTLGGYGDEVSRDKARTCVETEARALEILQDHPHSNIVTFHGCAVKDSLIVGLLLEELNEDLSTRIFDKTRPFIVDKCMREIKSALNHLHFKNCCHNDVKTGNIMVREDDTAVLIDFDSCLPEGEKLGKGCTSGWGNEDATISSVDNDNRAFVFLEQRLRAAVSAASLDGGAANGGGDVVSSSSVVVPAEATAATAAAATEDTAAAVESEEEHSKK